ncbi:MAG: tRNA glutamyl-Q(34) synthetase GluQRS [Methylobacterium mesophilicum]|nr:tRNA glutamyl-Q(34) synthetase GluQRS [Methylobacterium mesophilicum]
MAAPVFRFAPSPNGRLHLGHALSAGLNARMAERAGGRFLLRVEDIDRERSKPELERAMLDDLRWLGLRWEEPVRRQSDHMAEYEAALERLKGMGLVYPGFMSRGAIRARTADPAWPRDPDGAQLYPSDDRRLGEAECMQRIANGEPHGWRLDTCEAMKRVGVPLSWQEWTSEGLTESRRVAAQPEEWGDVLIARSTVPTSYHLSVVVDDALQGVSHVVRGQDLYHATSVHRLLQNLLGLPAPRYFHHRLVLGQDGRKLAKSEGSAGIGTLREAGWTPERVWREVGLG